MVVTIDNNFTSYEFGKNCIVKIRKIFKDGSEVYLFEYGFINSLNARISVWSSDVPAYLSKLIYLAFTFIGFDRNFTERDIRSLVCSIRNYLKRK